MALNEQIIPVNFSAGVDTKTDSKAVIIGKMLRLENSVFTNVNRITKRNGYTALSTVVAGIGSIVAPKMVHSFKDEAICADQSLLLSYSSSQGAWESKGPYVSTELAKMSIDQSKASSGYVDSAILGNYALYAWDIASQGAVNFSAVYASVVDLQTGTILYTSPSLGQFFAAGANPIRCVVLGTTTLALIYINNTENNLELRKVVFSGAGVVTISAPITITGGSAPAYGGYGFDVVSTATGASVAYFSAAGVAIVNLDTAGAYLASVDIADADAQYPISLSLNPTNSNLWVYWCSGVPTVSNNIYYAIVTSGLAAVLTRTLVAAIASPYFVINMIQTSQSATQHTLYWSIYLAGGGFSFVDSTNATTTTSAGVIGSNALFAFGISPYSRQYTLGSDNYAVFVYRGATTYSTLSFGYALAQIQPTYFLVRLTNIPTATGIPLVVARFASGLGNVQSVLAQTIGYTPNISLFSSNKLLLSVGVETQGFPSDYFSGFPYSPGALSGEFAYTIDFNSDNSYRATTCTDLVLLNGGVIQAYDGQSCNEFGFHLFPEIHLNVSATPGSVPNGAYSYIAIFQWTDAQGNLHQSTPSDPFPITIAGGPKAVDVTVTTAYLSQKIGVTVAIYRTQASGTIYYLVTNPVFPLSATAQAGASVTYIDGLDNSATQLTGNPQPYTSPGSSVLENTTPPPSMIMVAHNNRLWFADSENPNDIWYTKSFSPGTGLSPSGFMLEQIDHKFGDITALAEMDEKIIIFKETGIFVQSGDGVGDTGTGSSLSFPQIIPSDVGCSVLKSTVTMPKGVMFKSINGIYLIDRALNVSYIGAEVQNYNSQLITGATFVPGKSQIRFLCSTGLTLVYDYIFNQWSTFTAHTGVSSSTWNSIYIYSTGTLVYQEAAGVYADAGVAFAMLAQTSWLALASIQGFQRVRRLIMLGDFINGASASHNLSIAAAYDFSTTFQTSVTFAFGAISASGVFQYRERLPIQKCDAISLLIQETTTGNSSEYIDLTNISFEAGIKKGVNKLGGTKSVG